MAKLYNTFFSLASPKVLDPYDTKRVAYQIIATLKHANPKLKFSNLTCLDVGSSSGVISSHCAPFFKKTFCIDIDKHAISLGKERYANKKLILEVFDGWHIPYPKGYFDIVILRRVLSSLIKPKKLIGEVYRVLKPGGLCYFEEVNKITLLEPEYKLPFFTLLPPTITRLILSFLGGGEYYFGLYRTYWQLKSLLGKFIITDSTPDILKNPAHFKFKRLVPLTPILSRIPFKILSFLTYLSPNFIWVLKKPS